MQQLLLKLRQTGPSYPTKHSIQIQRMKQLWNDYLRWSQRQDVQQQVGKQEHERWRLQSMLRLDADGVSGIV